jgi:hypothetical protein
VNKSPHHKPALVDSLLTMDRKLRHNPPKTVLELDAELSRHPVAVARELRRTGQVTCHTERR